MHFKFGHDETLFDDCDVVVRQRIVNQRVAPCPLEGRSAAAEVAADGRLTFYSSTQTAHGVRDALATALAVEAGQVHVIAPDVGGGFGAKGSVYPEDVVVAWAARQLGRPARWTETRSESMVGLGHGRAQVQEVEIGGDRDGRILAYRIDVVQDSGAYPCIGAVLPFMTRTMATGVYDIKRGECSSNSVVTNTVPTVAYRGAGRPEAAAAIERAVDCFAAEIGMDPADVRRKNLIGPDEFPYTTPTQTEYDTGNYVRTLDLALEISGYDELRREQRRRREAGDRLQIGIGVSTYVEITNGIPEGEYGAVEVLPDGRASSAPGSSAHGQGHPHRLVDARLQGARHTDRARRVIQSTLTSSPAGVGTFGSRSLQAGGSAVHLAATGSSNGQVARRRAARGQPGRPCSRPGRRVSRCRGPLLGQLGRAVGGGEGQGRSSVWPRSISALCGPTFPFGRPSGCGRGRYRDRTP